MRYSLQTLCCPSLYVATVCVGLAIAATTHDQDSFRSMFYLCSWSALAICLNLPFFVNNLFYLLPLSSIHALR
ncbi:hypothetical protein HBI70_033450 [Parastagonospora nodorum]|nr:hypothetical protein HBH51_232460 [Parastagonospora nodorum]KAH4007795.1 hypothetical protein HBI10_000660 [Parastagonospora nodorum]KAH4016468.1 hypothetical protein HBI13_148680 [Parastagonospora nodorum]KAH4069399.1 hypothetical protein HBH50_112660 [Parastagonospora nodorum]KAH4088469.1 hypothetical protein HBH48_129630 [Parastagonospora nodorum]